MLSEACPQPQKTEPEAVLFLGSATPANPALLSRQCKWGMAVSGSSSKVSTRQERGLWLLYWMGPSKCSSQWYIHTSLSHHAVLTQCLLQAFLSSLSFCFLFGWFFGFVFVFSFFGWSVGWWYFLRLLATQVQKIPASQYLENNNYASVLGRVIQGYGSTSQTTHWASTTYLQHKITFSAHHSCRSWKWKRDATTHLQQSTTSTYIIKWHSLQRKVCSEKMQLKCLISMDNQNWEE